MKKYLNTIGKLAVLAVFALAVWLLYHKLRMYSLADIKHNLGRIPFRSLALSFTLMILNYLVMVGYDWLALKAIRKKLANGRVFMVSFVGCVISYNFGALLGGSTVRYRLYSAWGFTPLDIVRLVIMLAVTFWVGAMGLAGLIFLFVPLQIPHELGVNPNVIKPLGAGLLFLCGVYLAICHVSRGRPFMIFGKEFALPTLPIAAAQTVVAGLDLVVAASCLYALMPHNSGMSFFEFLPNYLLAQVTVVLTHVPGGMGVLEVIIMNLTQDIPGERVFAAILAFRVIYYLLPLMFAAIILGLYELYLRRHETDAFMQDASRWFRAWMPTLTGYTVFLTGAIMCLSTVVPVSSRALTLLQPYVPLWGAELAHIVTGLVGVMLLVSAYGLQRRLRKVRNLVLAALSIGVVSNIFKGMDWPEALLILAVLFPLATSRPSYGRIAPLWRGTYPVQWIVSVAVVIITAMLLGLHFAGLPTDSDVLLHSGYTLNGPRILRALAAQVVFLVVLVILYIRAKLSRVRP